MPNELTPEQELKIFGPDPDAPAEAAPSTAGNDKNTEVEASDDNPTTEAEATEQAPEEVGDPDLDKAWGALERDGWTKTDIKRLGVERIKELGLKRAKNHMDIDQAYADLKALKATKAAEKPKEEVLDRAASTNGDLSKVLDKFKELFGEDGANAIREALDPVLGKVGEIEKSLVKQQEAAAQAERARLQEKFSGLYSEVSKPALWNAIEQGAVERLNAGEASSNDEAVRMTLSELFGERAAQPKAEPRKATRTKDLPSTPDRASPAKPMTKQERELKVLEAIESGATLDDARKILN